jgi:hypothetical protein
MKRLIPIFLLLILLIFFTACGNSTTEEEIPPAVPVAPSTDSPPAPTDSSPTSTDISSEEAPPEPTQEIVEETPEIEQNTQAPEEPPDITINTENATGEEPGPDEATDNETEKAKKWVDELPSYELVFTPYGLMNDYHCQRIPVSIYIPGMMKDDYSDMWVKSDFTGEGEIPPYPLLQRHSEQFLSQLTITETSFQELELPEMTLDEYASIVIDTNSYSVPDFQLTSADKYELSDNITIALIIFSSESGQRVFNRFIYIHESGYIFNLTYTYYPEIDDISEMIEYSFGSFRRDDGD